MKQIVNELTQLNYRVCGIYLLDSQFVEDTPKFFQGVMTCMSAMLQLEIPHINVLTKMDLCMDTSKIERFLSSDSSLLLEDANERMAPKYRDLNAALVRMVI
jgi:GPN-loop GTPase